MISYQPTNLMGLNPCLSNITFYVQLFKHIFTSLYANSNYDDVLFCLNLSLGAVSAHVFLLPVT